MFEENSNKSNIMQKNGLVDKITLELLMNKNHYNRYISKTDPKRHEEYVEHMEKVKKYTEHILNTTRDFLDDPNHQVTTEVNEAYENYVRTLICHFDYKRMENLNENHNDDNDDDVLFGNMDNKLKEPEPPSKSYWGKNKVVKKKSASYYAMNLIPRMRPNDVETDEL